MYYNILLTSPLFFSPLLSIIMKLRSVASRSSNGSRKQKNSRRSSNASSKKNNMNPFLNRKSGKSDRDSCSIEDLDDGEEPKKKIPSPWMGRSRRNSDSSETSEETVNTFTKNQGKLDNKNRKGEKHSSTTISARKSGKSAVSKVIAINF